jgi:hypothetical protein
MSFPGYYPCFALLCSALFAVLGGPLAPSVCHRSCFGFSVPFGRLSHKIHFLIPDTSVPWLRLFFRRKFVFHTVYFITWISILRDLFGFGISGAWLGLEMGMGGIDVLAFIGMQLELRGRSDNVYDKIGPPGGGRMGKGR